MIITWDFHLMAFMYTIAGLFHLWNPKIYIRIIPPYIPYPQLLVFLSGLLEVVFSLGLLFEETKTFCIYGISIMLCVYFTVHSYMLQSKEASLGVPKWVLWLRLPLQFLLIWWVLYYL